MNLVTKLLYRYHWCSLAPFSLYFVTTVLYNYEFDGTTNNYIYIEWRVTLQSKKNFWMQYLEEARVGLFSKGKYRDNNDIVLESQASYKTNDYLRNIKHSKRCHHWNATIILLKSQMCNIRFLQRGKNIKKRIVLFSIWSLIIDTCTNRDINALS